MINIPSIKEITQDLKDKNAEPNTRIILGQAHDLIVNGANLTYTTADGGTTTTIGGRCDDFESTCTPKVCA